MVVINGKFPQTGQNSVAYNKKIFVTNYSFSFLVNETFSCLQSYRVLASCNMTNIYLVSHISQPATTCSKLTMET